MSVIFSPGKAGDGISSLEFLVENIRASCGNSRDYQFYMINYFKVGAKELFGAASICV